MKITIEATPQIVTVSGVPCRRWKDMTEKGVECDVFVRILRVRSDRDLTQFADELKELPEPTMLAIDLRFLH